MPTPSLTSPNPFGPRDRLARLLIGLVLLTVCLLIFAVWQSGEEVKIAYDLNRSGSLRYRSLYIYGLITQKNITSPTDAPAPRGDWLAVLKQMEDIRADLRRRYPQAVSHSDGSWQQFAASLQANNTVDWATTNRVREDADTLTGEIEDLVRKRMQTMTIVYAFGIASLAFALPWGVVLFGELRETQRQLGQENAERDAAAHRFASLFTGVPAACYAFDSVGKILIWNTAAETIFGLSAAEVTNKPLTEVLSVPEGALELDKTVTQVMNGAEINNVEWKHVTPNGETRYLLSNVFPLRDRDDRIIGGVSATLDISDRKEAEQRLQSVLVGVRCMVWDAVVEQHNEAPYFRWSIRLWNEQAAQQLVPLDTTGTDYIEAWLVSRQEDQTAMDDHSAAAFRTGLSGYTQEFRCRDRHGVMHWLSEDARIQSLEEGRWRVIGVCTDVTARKEAEERLQSLTKELERSNAALQDFASIASHDLKEPLRKIHTFGNMLTRKLENLSPDAQSYLDRMLAAATRMQTLIDGLLSFSRITTKGNAFAPTDLNEVVKGVLTDLEVRIQEARATIMVAPLPILTADALQMRQLFQNLIGNALKFHREGEPCCVRIAYAHSDGRHIITITDNGIGFSPKDAERIFEVFERLEGSGREGTGIGLAICRKIAERHGGTLTATGTPGSGATFTLTL